MIPVLWALYTSLRPYSDTAEHGYVSIAHALSFENYKNAWTQADLPHYYINSAIVTIPRSSSRSCSPHSCVRHLALQLKFNLALLMLFTAGTCCPSR